VGTSGWVYPDWIGRVYPKGVRSAEVFPYYLGHFDTVELNATFYHFPRESTVEKWRSLPGSKFVWSVKAWRWLTHIKRLKGVRKDASEFLTRIRPLAKSGVVLFQLPPSFKKDLRRLATFLRALPAGFRFAFEFRHNSWFAPDTYEVLRSHDVALVGMDAPGIERVLDVRTAHCAYFRLHGRSQWYFHNYNAQELAPFADAARAHVQSGDVFVYFDNTANGHAFYNAQAFKEMV
jgi:uncharacterized protein YecE (DUF72 family)